MGYNFSEFEIDNQNDYELIKDIYSQNKEMNIV